MIADEKIGLKLIGKNQEDLKVISAYLQDSVVKIKNIAFLKQNRNFVMVLNRFMWEDVERGVLRKNKRIRCVVKFDCIIQAKSQKINQKKKNKILECLAIKSILSFNETYDIKIFFSGGGIITLVAEAIDVVLDDLGEPWNVKNVPIHKI